jgi:uncharacterized protein HemY
MTGTSTDVVDDKEANDVHFVLFGTVVIHVSVIVIVVVVVIVVVILLAFDYLLKTCLSSSSIYRVVERKKQ